MTDLLTVLLKDQPLNPCHPIFRAKDL
jgi:hypothetical protein